jgi:hypothetical protein
MIWGTASVIHSSTGLVRLAALPETLARFSHEVTLVYPWYVRIVPTVLCSHTP